jgi:protein-S-isoprenylcysteine O-methyltransferase Ste14
MMLLGLRALFAFALPAVMLLWIPSLLWPRGRTPDPLDLAGIPLIVAGAAVLIDCVVKFAVKGKGTLAPIDPPKKLVTGGLYRFVRNPMYVGGLLVLFGQALFFRSSSLLLYALAWWLAVHLFIVLYEEPHLRSVFGTDYENYRTAVPRWIPRFRAEERS